MGAYRWCECGRGCVYVISIMWMSYMNLSFTLVELHSKLPLNSTVLSRFLVLCYDSNVDMSSHKRFLRVLVLPGLLPRSIIAESAFF